MSDRYVAGLEHDERLLDSLNGLENRLDRVNAICQPDKSRVEASQEEEDDAARATDDAASQFSKN